MFSFVLKKSRRAALFASLIPALLTGLLFASCLLEGIIPVNAEKPKIIDITTNPPDGEWNVAEANNFTLTVAAVSPDGGTLSYQWYKNTANSTTGGIALGSTTTIPTLTLAKEDYLSNQDYYFYVMVTNTIGDNGDKGTKTVTVGSNFAAVTVSGNGVAMVNVGQPDISGQPTGGSWDVGSANNFTLTVTANIADGGNLSFQWYSNTSNSNTGGSVISGQTSATLTLAKGDYTSNGAYYFYVVVTNTITDNDDGGTKTATATSAVATVTVSGNTVPTVNAQSPAISGQPSGGTWNVSNAATFSLSVTASITDGGTLSYQWYKNTSNSATGGTPIGTNNPLTLAKGDYPSDGAYYFYVVVTNTNNNVNGTKTATVTSTVATVTVSGNTVPTVNAQPPAITSQPAATGTWNNTTGSTHTRTVAASSPDGGNLSYQWYSNTSNANTGGSVISGQTIATLTLQSANYPTAGTYYFYVVVTNTNNAATGTKTATTTSNVAAVTVTIPTVNAAAPTITSQPAGATWNVNTNPANLSSINPKVTATVSDGGTLTYQWYRNTTNSTTGGTAISGQTGTTLSLTSIRSVYLSSGNGTRYVYVVVTNTNNAATGTKTATTTSSAAAIVMQGIVPFSPVAAWPSGTHYATGTGSANFETIIQAVAGYYPSSLGFPGDSYWIRRFGDLTNTEKTALGIPTSGTVTTRGGVTVTANDYIYGQDGWSGGGYSGVIRAIVSYGGNNNSAWRGAFVVEFITAGSWDAGNNRFFGYCFGFKTQDEIGTSTNMNVPAFTDSAAGVASTWTAANGPGINGNANTYFGGWRRDPDPWPTN